LYTLSLHDALPIWTIAVILPVCISAVRRSFHVTPRHPFRRLPQLLVPCLTQPRDALADTRRRGTGRCVHHRRRLYRAEYRHRTGPTRAFGGAAESAADWLGCQRPQRWPVDPRRRP